MNEESVNKPWGSYQTLYADDITKVKLIRILPNQRPSYQYHFKRTETWVVVNGKGLLTLDGDTKNVQKGSVIFVEREAKHRIQNTGEEDLVFVEVQMGEDDIVRVEDDYSR